MRLSLPFASLRFASLRFAALRVAALLSAVYLAAPLAGALAQTARKEAGAPPAPARPGKATKPVAPADAQKAAVEAFNAAINGGDGQKLLSLWPPTGAVKLFGKKVPRAAAEKALAAKDGVYKLLRWPGPDAETGAGATPPADPRVKGDTLTITDAAYDKQPACTLAKSTGGAWLLQSCKMVDNGAP